mgnify:CR=1 FL=1
MTPLIYHWRDVLNFWTICLLNGWRGGEAIAERARSVLPRQCRRHLMIADQPIPKARGRRRSRRGEGMQAPAIMQRPFAQLTRPYPAVERISDDQIEHIHHASLELLSKTGLDVLHEECVHLQ